MSNTASKTIEFKFNLSSGNFNGIQEESLKLPNNNFVMQLLVDFLPKNNQPKVEIKNKGLSNERKYLVFNLTKTQLAKFQTSQAYKAYLIMDNLFNIGKVKGASRITCKRMNIESLQIHKQKAIEFNVQFTPKTETPKEEPKESIDTAKTKKNTDKPKENKISQTVVTKGQSLSLLDFMNESVTIK